MEVKRYSLKVSIDKELIEKVKLARDFMKAKNCNRVVNDILRRELDALLGTTKKQEVN